MSEAEHPLRRESDRMLAAIQREIAVVAATLKAHTEQEEAFQAEVREGITRLDHAVHGNGSPGLVRAVERMVATQEAHAEVIADVKRQKDYVAKGAVLALLTGLLWLLIQHEGGLRVLLGGK